MTLGVVTSNIIGVMNPNITRGMTPDIAGSVTSDIAGAVTCDIRTDVTLDPRASVKPSVGRRGAVTFDSGKELYIGDVVTLDIADGETLRSKR